MEELKADMLMLKFADKIQKDKAVILRSQLSNADDTAFSRVAMIQTYNPLLTLILSMAFGLIGVDRFYVGDVGLGVCKLLFGWVTFFIWPLVDIYFCYQKEKKKNLSKINEALAMPHF